MRPRETITVLFVLASALLYGCDHNAATGVEPSQQGTVKAVENCIAKNSSQLVEEKVMRRLCIGEHERSLDAEYFCRSGTNVDSEIDCLAYFTESNGRLSLNGHITNQSSALVLTRYSVEILFVHEQLEIKTEYKGQWIQPNGSDEFEIPFDSKRRVESASVVRINDMDWQVRLYDFQVIRIEVM